MKRKTGIIITTAATVTVAAAIAMAWHISGREAQADGRALLAKGMKEVNMNNVAQAFSHLQQATTALKEQNDTNGLFEAAVYTAVLYDQIGRRDSAYAILRRTAFRDVPNYKDYASQYYLRMMGHYKAAIDHDYAAAESFTLRAIEFSREKYPGDAMYMYVDMANLAETYITAGQPGKARRLLDRCCQEIRNPAVQTDKYGYSDRIGILYQLLGEASLGIRHWMDWYTDRTQYADWYLTLSPERLLACDEELVRILYAQSDGLQNALRCGMPVEEKTITRYLHTAQTARLRLQQCGSRYTRLIDELTAPFNGTEEDTIH